MGQTPSPVVFDERWTVNGALATVWRKPPMYRWGYVGEKAGGST